MLIVEVGCRNSRDEELAAVGVGTGVLNEEREGSMDGDLVLGARVDLQPCLTARGRRA